MPIAIGIDLGTAYTAVGVYLNGEIQLIPFETGKKFIPSYVAFTKTGHLVGDAAKHQAISNPKNTIFGVKRFIGRRFDDPIVQENKKFLPYEIENHEGKPKISVTYKGEEKTYDPEEITAMILKKVKHNAEVQLGHEVTSAVLTVPASFNDSQRQATKDAGRIAGLKILRILNEPTAAAIAYGLDKTSKEKNVLICDLGCGAFDASVLKIKQGKTFEVQSTVGDPNFGGADFDFKIVSYIADYFYEMQGKDIREYAQAIRRLDIACEDAKKILATKDEAVVTVDDITDGIDLNINISRSKFEELCEPLFEKIMDLLEKALLESGISKTGIDDVVFVGGSSRIPKLHSLVSDYFDGKFICASVHQDEAITYGAAVQAAMLSGYKDKKFKDLLCVDVTPLSIGIETSGGAMTTVIERNTNIPCKASYKVTTSTENQSDILIKVFEGERARTADNHLLGNMELSGLPPLPQGVPQVEVNFEIDSDGILTVSAEKNVYIQPKSTSIKLEKGRLSCEEIHRMLREAQDFQRQDVEDRERIRYKVTLEGYIISIKNATSMFQEKISDRDKLEIHKICRESREWIQMNPNADRDSLIEKRKEVLKLLQPFATVLNLSASGERERRMSLPVASSIKNIADQI